MVSLPENAMEKHPACAAATSSSGLVPGSSANLWPHVDFASVKTPLGAVMVPVPSFNVPFQTAVACRSILRRRRWGTVVGRSCFLEASARSGRLQLAALNGGRECWRYSFPFEQDHAEALARDSASQLVVEDRSVAA